MVHDVNELLPKLFSLVLFLALLIFIWLTPKANLNMENTTLMKDLRVWASLLLLTQAILYLIF